MVLTRQGAALLPVARDLLERWRDGVEAARAAAPSGTLVIGMQTAVGRGLQQEALRRFREAMPGWEVSLRLVGWDDPSGGLADGSSDVAFLWLPVPPGVRTHVLASERRGVAVPAGHPLAELDEVPFAALRDEPFIALPRAAGPLRAFWLGVTPPLPERKRLLAPASTGGDGQALTDAPRHEPDSILWRRRMRKVLSLHARALTALPLPIPPTAEAAGPLGSR
ncbi:LysR substrate binding domain-containing protein [Nonomuraea maritima]|uniref:LysR substrate binding domain-containing protein n=1 Tax=Nonomuraea maritima TaxID=683260 RepID=A0A1G9I1C9_9ACTN|nr:LysR substrate binding domain-containing protein [Nonomuraea maritima]